MKIRHVLFESNNTSVKTIQTQNILFNPYNASQITISENVCLLLNISIDASSDDTDLTGHTGSTLFVGDALNISAVDKSIRLFCHMRFKG